MSGRLQDKVAIVIGAGSVGPGWGNGRATAFRFAQEGARVWAVDRDLDHLEETWRASTRSAARSRHTPAMRPTARRSRLWWQRAAPAGRELTSWSTTSAVPRPEVRST